MAEKTKKKLEEATQFRSIKVVIDPPSSIRRHVKWKMARAKKTGQMTSEAAKEIAEKIEQASQGSFVPHGRHNVLTAAIGRPEHPGHVHVARAGVTIKQYFGSAPWTSLTSSSMAIEELEHLTQQIRDRLKESITKKGLALPPEPEVGPSTAHVSTKKSYVGPSRNDPDTGDSDKCGLYIKENPPRLGSLGRVYEGSTTVHSIPLLHDQVKVGVEEVKDADAPVPVPTNEVNLVGQTLNTFLGAVDRPDHVVMWDVVVFVHEDLSEITHGGQCLNISIIQLWILHLTETSMRARNSDLYGFLEPQSIQRYGQLQFESESYLKN
ncbi:hypothetical protein GmHk_18G051618 [Glycine max]|nr:hypothetical protein GmHk_18G051618 [Glycine max]